MESLRATVKAYAEGKIELGKISTNTRKNEIRNAPFFGMVDVVRAGGTRPYTAWTLCSYLGWVQPSGKPTEFSYSLLSALEPVEMGILPPAGIETPKAEERKAEGQKKGGETAGKGRPKVSAKFAESNRSEREARSKAAKATGFSHEKLRQAKVVQRDAKKRQKAGKSLDGRAGGRGRKKPGGNFPQGLSKTRDRLGAKVGCSGRTKRKRRTMRH